MGGGHWRMTSVSSIEGKLNQQLNVERKDLKKIPSVFRVDPQK